MKKMKWLLIMTVLAVLAIPAAQSGLKVKVKAQKANVRATPDVSSPVVRAVTAGMEFNVIEKSGSWYKVQLPADGIHPAEKGFIHGSVVSESGEIFSAPPMLQARPGKSPRSHPARTKKFKPFSVRASYFMGFSAETLTSTYTPTVYQEPASFVTAYEAKKGNSIDAAVGYRFSAALGIEAGAAIASRDVAATMTAAVPHPLLFDNPRQASGSAGYKLKETDLYLNLVYTFAMKGLAFDLFAGPCFAMAETTLVSQYQVTDSAYPYATVDVAYGSQAVKKNAIGFNAGIAAGYYFSDSVGLVASVRFIGAKAKFATGSDVPGVDFKLGGLQAGAGVKIKF
jgi:hypothetical protein